MVESDHVLGEGAGGENWILSEEIMFKQHLIWRKDISVETVWGGQSRLLRMNRKGVQEGMGLTHSWSRKICVTGVSEQGTTRAGSQHQVGSMGCWRQS